MSTQQSSQSNHSKLTRSSRRRSSNGLLELFKRHPWIFWSGVWISLLCTAAFVSSIAIFSLTHTGHIARQEPQSNSVAAQKAKTSSHNVVYLWVLGAVALTCSTAGYLAISKKPNSSLWSLKRSSARMPTRRQRRKRSLQGLPPVPIPHEPIQPVTPPVLAEIEPVVTVLPPEESHPLDASEESLAEIMDIRKQRPLSSILGDFKQE